MAFDINATASSVYGIVGAGIGLGVLAGTSGMVMRSMERNVYGGSGEDYKRPYSYRGRGNGYGRQEEEEYRPQPRTYQKRKTTRKKTKSKKRKTTKKRTTIQRRMTYEDEPQRQYYGGGYGSPRLNIPRYW